MWRNLCNQKRRTHHRYAFSPRGFERKQLIRILCEHKCALIFTLVADDLTNRCWVLTKTRSFYSLTKKRFASKTATLIAKLGREAIGIRELVYLKETEIKTELFKLNYLICIIQIKVVSLQRFLECIMLQIENYGKND